MKSIPTLYLRDLDAPGTPVIAEVNPDCAWVFDGDPNVTAFRKYNGQCTLYDGHAWWVRRVIAATDPHPSGMVVVDVDTVSNATIGWEPAAQTEFGPAIIEAIAEAEADRGLPLEWDTGTYELIGPNIEENPEGVSGPQLICHATTAQARLELGDTVEETFEKLRAQFQLIKSLYHGEGLVWRHPDGRMAKLKVSDFAPDGHGDVIAEGPDRKSQP